MQMTRISLNQTVKESVSTYRWPLELSDWLSDTMQIDLDEAERNAEGKVKLVNLDWTIDYVDRKSLYCDYDIDRDKFEEEMISSIQYKIEEYVRLKKKMEFGDILSKYGIVFGWLQFRMPKEYNFKDDSVDILLEEDITEDQTKKYLQRHQDLIPYVQEYILNVRQESYDWYMSFEPIHLDDVDFNDYCVLRAILTKEEIYDEVKEAIRDCVEEEWYEWRDLSANKYYEVNWKHYKFDWLQLEEF